MKEEFQVSDYWLRDYFQYRKQFVEIDMKKSEVSANPSPKFFAYFINDIVKVLTFWKIQIFVDYSNLVFVGEWEKMVNW